MVVVIIEKYIQSLSPCFHVGKLLQEKKYFKNIFCKSESQKYNTGKWRIINMIL